MVYDRRLIKRCNHTVYNKKYEGVLAEDKQLLELQKTVKQMALHGT